MNLVEETQRRICLSMEQFKREMDAAGEYIDFTLKNSKTGVSITVKEGSPPPPEPEIIEGIEEEMVEEWVDLGEQMNPYGEGFVLGDTHLGGDTMLGDGDPDMVDDGDTEE